MRVLIADDQRVREGLATIITSLGMEVVALAEDGEQALAHCEQHRPDVVLMDLRMPKVAGAEEPRPYGRAFRRRRSSCSRPTRTTSRSSPPCRLERRAI